MKQPISAKAVLVALVCLSAGLRAENLAKGRVTTIISSLNTEASFCTDGDYYGFGHYKTCHTNVHVNPWIQVQLDEVVHVRTVVIVNREDMASNKLIGSEIRVGNLTDPKDANPSCGVVVDEGEYMTATSGAVLSQSGEPPQLTLTTILQRSPCGPRRTSLRKA